MSLAIEPAESNQPLERSNEDESENDANSLEEDDDGVDLDVVNGLTKVVIKLVSIDQKVSAKESWESEAEEETFKVNDGLDQKENGCENSKPLEEVPVRDIANKRPCRTFCLRRRGESLVSRACWLAVEQAGPAGSVVPLNNVKWGESCFKAKYSEIEGEENNFSVIGGRNDLGQFSITSEKK